MQNTDALSFVLQRLYGNKISLSIMICVVWKLVKGIRFKERDFLKLTKNKTIILSFKWNIKRSPSFSCKTPWHVVDQLNYSICILSPSLYFNKNIKSTEMARFTATERPSITSNDPSTLSHEIRRLIWNLNPLHSQKIHIAKIQKKPEK